MSINLRPDQKDVVRSLVQQVRAGNLAEEFSLVESRHGLEVIRELYGKLGNRVDVQGIVVSMSGFTEGAMKQVSDYHNERIILLFGPRDVHSMIFERVPFDELLSQKFGTLVTRGKVIFD
jgi:hypothetical protein